MSKRVDKKGVSIMIGYVLLISIAVIMSGATYAWIKTYAPKDLPSCKGGVSIEIINSTCVKNLSLPGTYDLTINLKNNGRFNYGGYNIRGNKNSEGLATIDLSENISNSETLFLNPGIKFHETGELNSFKTGDAINHTFINVPNLRYIEIIPLIYYGEGNVESVGCSNARAKELLACGTICGDNAIQTPNDDGINEICDGSDFPAGQNCTTNTSGARPFGSLNCASDCLSFNNATCTASGGGGFCGDGSIDSPAENCDDGNLDNGDGCDSNCQTETDWVCVNEPSVCFSPLAFSDSLVAWYKMDDDPSDGIIDDSSGNANHGSCTSCPSWTTDKDSFSNKAYNFDGSSNFIDINFDLPDPEGTIIAWVDPAVETTTMIAVWGGETNGNGFGTHDEIHLGTGPNAFLDYSDQRDNFAMGAYADSGESLSTHCVDSASYSASAGWYFLVGNYSGIDGSSNPQCGLSKADTSTPPSLAASDSTGTAVNPSLFGGRTYIGKPSKNERYWNGEMDEVLIFNKSLSAQNITDLYNYYT